MRTLINNFAASLGLTLTAQQTDSLLLYADLVWEKKAFLNLTSVSAKEEIISRHICDGVAGAAYLAARMAAGKKSFSLADMGAGAGYIGLTCAVCLPQASVVLVESLQRRCSFLNWTVLKIGLKNVTVLNNRLGQQPVGVFDVVTERAMGRLNDILPLVSAALKEGGVFAAYQSTPDEARAETLQRLSLRQETPYAYTLPKETKQRFLAVFSSEMKSAL